jgi:hypothetical protein
MDRNWKHCYTNVAYGSVESDTKKWVDDKLNSLFFFFSTPMMIFVILHTLFSGKEPI